MHITLDMTMTMQVTPEEFNLIGLALCGRLKPEQLEAANILNRQLLEQRKAAHMHHVQLVDRALESLSVVVGKPR